MRSRGLKAKTWCMSWLVGLIEALIETHKQVGCIGYMVEFRTGNDRTIGQNDIHVPCQATDTYT